MRKRLKVELGVLAGCAALIAGANIAIESSKSNEKPIANSSFVEESSLPDEKPEITVSTKTTATTTKATTPATTPETTPATTAATTPETTADTTAATTPETTPATTVATTQSTTTAKPNEKTVYVARSGEGTKYHSIPDCGNMSDPREIPISEAEALGYTPCKKCY